MPRLERAQRGIGWHGLLLAAGIDNRYFGPIRTTMSDPNLSSFIWSVADLLRGDYKQSEYGKVILPFTVLRRLDCVLEPTKVAVLAEKQTREAAGLNPEAFLLRKSGQFFYNTSPLDLKKLMGDQDHIGENLRAYMQAFSPAVRDIFESFDFHTQIDKLAKSGLLYLVTEKFANIDLHPRWSATPRWAPSSRN
jgi:type I restriction enzyme M protein